MKEKPIIIAIVGPSGSGKTTLSRFAAKALGYNLVCSYTTRPMREGEADGVDHYFVSEDDMPPKEKMLAYTCFGGYHYWTTKDQIEGVCIYVIDEDGVRMLKRRNCTFVAVYVTRDNIDVDKERMDRDKGRKPLDGYSYVVNNKGSLENFLFTGTNTIHLACSLLNFAISTKLMNI